MTTLFLDYEGGNDNYGGSSFALLASGTDGRITSTTFSAAGASFPNDGSLINQYLSIFNGSIYAVYQIIAWLSGTSLTIAAISGGTALANQAVDQQYYIGGRWKTLTTGATAVRIVPGDTLRFMASPEPTSVGNAEWRDWFSDGARPYTNANISSSTNATPIEITTSAAHNFVTGDFVCIDQHNTNTFANGLWKVTYVSATKFTLDGSVGNGVGGGTGTARYFSNRVVELATACTQKIADCSLQEGAWTASANVTASVSVADFKAHYGSAEIAIGESFATGLAAYFPTGALDLSGYQQLSLTIKQVSGTVLADNDLTIKLCSDTAGATPVDTINLKSPKLLTNWTTLTVNTGAALGASIQSVALYVNTDSGAQTIRIGQLVACKAASANDSLTLSSLIGKSSETTNRAWYPIMSVRGRAVMLDSYGPSGSMPRYANTPDPKGYVGTSEAAAATLKREAILVSLVASGAHPEFSTTEAGLLASRTLLSGGWDRTNMSTQSGDSWYDSANCGPTQLYLQHSYVNAERFSFVRTTQGLQLNTDNFASVSRIGSAGAVQAGLVIVSSNECVITDVCGYSSNPLQMAQSDRCVVSNLRSVGGGTFLQSNNCIIDNFDIALSHYAVLTANYAYSSGSILRNGTIRNYANSYGALWAFYGDLYLQNVVLTSPLLVESNVLNSDWRVFSHNHDNTINDRRIFMEQGLVRTDATVVHGAAAYSWKVSPLSATVRAAHYPMFFPLAKIALAANISKTIGVWMRRDNTGLTMKLVCKGGQIAGIAADVTASMIAAINTWELVSITLTPTETGVVELEAHAYGGATYNGWVSEMEIA